MPVISKITGAPFRFWCQKVLPAVYDDSLSYYELLCKVVDYLNKVMEDDINVINLVNENEQNYLQLKEYVDTYFDNLDVQNEINNKLDAMAEDGSLLAIIAPHLDEIIGEYEATLDEDLAKYKETVDNDITEFKNAVNTELDAQDSDIANFKNTVNGQVALQNTEITNFKTAVNTQISAQNDNISQQDDDITVMKAQLANFLSSATPDANAELLDIRVGALGNITYPTAGDAVRGQVSNLNDSVVHINSDGLMFLNDYEQGNFSATGEIVPSNYYITSAEHIFDFPVIVNPTENYRYNVWIYLDNTWSSTGLITGSQYNIQEGAKFRISIARTTSATVSPLNDSDKVILLGYVGYNIWHNSENIELLKNGKCLLPFKFRIGNDALGTWADYIKYRVTNKEFIKFDKDVTIFIKDGFKIGPHTFDNQGNFVADLGWKTKEFKASANTNYRFVIAKDPEDTTIIANIEDFYTAICMTTDIYTAANPLKLPFMMNGRAKLAAHTGYTAEGDPENTLPSFEKAGKLGYWGIESDLQETSDGYYVMCHDSTVDRTTNGTGTISNMTLAQVRALHIKNHDDLKIPTLEEYLSICKMYGCVPVIEIKSTVTNTVANYLNIISILNKYGISNQCILIGSKWIIANIKSASKDIPYMPVYQSGFSYDFTTEFNLCSAYENMGMDWDYTSGVSLDQATTLHNSNMLFGVFTVDDVIDVKYAFLTGADFVTTNTVKPTD